VNANDERAPYGDSQGQDGGRVLPTCSREELRAVLQAFHSQPKVEGLDYGEARPIMFADPESSEIEKETADICHNFIAFALLFKHIAVTERGDLAIVQSLSKVGDKICVLPGSRTPYTIRKVSRDDETDVRYEFVGESYVDDLTSGACLSMAAGHCSGVSLDFYPRRSTQ
jgi:hypothetical protein